MLEENPQNAADEPVAKRPTRLSKGEVLFDASVYGVMNYIGTFLATVALADVLKTSKLGIKVCEKGKKLFMKAGMREALADSAVTTTILMPGGSVMLAPVYLLEKCRAGIVRRLNHMLGDKTAETNDAPARPQQTVGSLIKGRLVAWGVVFMTMVGAEAAVGKTKFEAYSAKAGEKLAALFKVPAHQRNTSSRIYRYGELGALDLLATAASVAVLYVSSKFFAQRREEHKEYIERHPRAARKFADEAELQDAVQAAPQPENAPDTRVSGEKLAAGALATPPQPAIHPV